MSSILKSDEIKLRDYWLDSDTVCSGFPSVIFYRIPWWCWHSLSFLLKRMLIMQLNGLSVCVRSPIQVKLLLPALADPILNSKQRPFSDCQSLCLRWMWLWKADFRWIGVCLTESIPACIFSSVSPTSVKAVFWLSIVPCSEGSPTGTRNTFRKQILQLLLKGIGIHSILQNGSSGRPREFMSESEFERWWIYIVLPLSRWDLGHI